MIYNRNFPPMLAARSANRQGPSKTFEDYMDTGLYVADTKLDGVRALARWDDATNEVVLWNRQQVDITYRYPDVAAELTPVLTGITGWILDGEIVAKDGRFESTLIRDQQQNPKSVQLAMAQHPAMYVAFDLIDVDANGYPERGAGAVPYVTRRAALEQVAGMFSLQITVTSDSRDFLAQTRDLGMEGAVIKLKNAPYGKGRTKSWVKFRNLFRVTCLVSSYTPGQGTRQAFGAMELALLGVDGPVSVGRCGTGFKEHEWPLLKAHLDLGASPLVVEIEATNQTKGGTLRFPVFKGVRSDVLPTDCTLDQLQGLPTC